MNQIFSALIGSSLLVSGITVFSVLTGWQAPAAAVIFTGSQGNLAASADFQISGNTLTLTLTNTSTADSNVPSDVLTAVFFKLPNNINLTLNSVFLNNGSNLLHNGVVQTNPGDIKAPPFAGGWALPNNFGSIPGGANQGLGTAGLGIFQGNVVNIPGQGGNFNYGLVGSGYTSAGDNAPVLASKLIKNSIVFNLSGVSGLAEQDISNVSFQYGTSLNETRIPGNPSTTPPPVRDVPEPSTTAAIGLLALSSLGLLKKKSHESKTSV
ncbi:MAG: PEP-CTERM sorting domain-containing protein [Hydrococcus sp. C42_A2020_068]|nr:PEP-CTERM sorting domain-containing protein [Hydrococcus sp. C42_A2020_068]